MPRTAQLSLPLVMPAQAQKHVTVNQAFALLDTVVQLRVKSSTTMVPPAAVSEGEAFLVPVGASGAWESRSGSIAVWSNGGWSFLPPRPGWRAWDAGIAGWQTFDGTSWLPHAVAVSGGGAQLSGRVLEFDHRFVAGATNLTTSVVPAGAQVIGVSGRVIEAINGPGLTTWRIGVSGSDNRYGSGLGAALNSYLAGLSGAPLAYYAATPLLLSAEGGSFASGSVRLAVHLLEIVPPRPI